MAVRRLPSQESSRLRDSLRWVSICLASTFLPELCSGLVKFQLVRSLLYLVTFNYRLRAEYITPYKYASLSSNDTFTMYNAIQDGMINSHAVETLAALLNLHFTFRSTDIRGGLIYL